MFLTFVQDLLLAYTQAVRAVVPLSLSTVHTALLGLAMGCARLFLRTEVLPHPDVTLAIVLWEESILTRFGMGALDVGPALAWHNPGSRRSATLDDQLLKSAQLIQGQLARVLPDTSEVNGPQL